MTIYCHRDVEHHIQRNMPERRIQTGMFPVTESMAHIKRRCLPEGQEEDINTTPNITSADRGRVVNT